MNFTNPVNLIPAAVGLILGAGNYTMTFDHGNIAFSGIATGAFGAIIVYQVMKYLAARGTFRDGGLPFLVPLSTLAQNGDPDELPLATVTVAGAPRLTNGANGKTDAPEVVKSHMTNGAKDKTDTPAVTT